MVDGARRLSKLPGEAEEGRLVKKGFNFGFPLITSGNMPESDKLATYQRQWSEVYHFVSLIAESGALELQNVTVAEKKVVEAPKPTRGQRQQKKVVEEKAPLASTETYSFKFTARPAALVEVINRLITEERFVTVDALSFLRADDALATILGGGKEKESARKRKRNKRHSAEGEDANAEGDEKAANKKGLVTDPATGVPFTVELTVTTYDFGKGTKPYSSLRSVAREEEEAEETAAAETVQAEPSAETKAEEAKAGAEETKEVK